MAENTDDRIRLTLSRSTGFTLDVDLTLPNGGVTVLFGVSGCGKTTVLRSAAGLEKAKGYVRIAGQVWQDDEKRIFVPTYERRIGYVFQEASLFDHLNVRENLRFGLKRISDKDGEKRLDDAVELLGIGHLLERRTSELSGGERQRCAIARSLAIKPTALFMDEPLAALDHARRLEIMPWIDRLKKELNLPILYVTHSEEEVMRLADRLAVIDNGKLVEAEAVSLETFDDEASAADTIPAPIATHDVRQETPEEKRPTCPAATDGPLGEPFDLRRAVIYSEILKPKFEE